MKKVRLLAVGAALLLTAAFSACDGSQKGLVAVEAKSVTCTEDGNTAYWYNPKSGKYYSDEKGDNEISAESVVLSATGHDWDEGKETVPADCVSEGKRTYTCKVCGEKKTEPIDALSADGVHDWVYAFDETGHSAECSVCGVALEHAAHEWEDNVCTVCGYDAGGSKGLVYTFDEGENTYAVAGIGTCTDAYVKIPAVYNGAEVTSIAENAFKNCVKMKGITVPETVTLIGNGALTSKGAFNGCSNLETMVLPFIGQRAGITSAGQPALFGYIFGAESYDGSVRTKQMYSETGSGTYYIPASLRSITVTGGNVYYGAFYSCSQIVSITLTDEVKTIGGRAFDGCTALTEITIGRYVTNIPNNTFNNCTSLQTVYFNGTEEEWNAINIGVTNNGAVTKATIYYNGERE